MSGDAPTGHGFVKNIDLAAVWPVLGILILSAQLAMIVGLLVFRSRSRRAEEARQTAILRAIPDLIFVVRRDGTFLDYSARDPNALFAPPSRFLGRNIREVLPTEAANTLMDALARASVSEGPVVVEYELPMGSPRYFEARLACVEPDRVLSIVRDVTDTKRTIQRNRDLAGRLIANQEVERTRIARDLHDGICQEAAAVSVDLSVLRQSRGDLESRQVQERLVQLQRRTANLAENIRVLSHGLHPSVLQHIGLTAALQSHCMEMQRRHGLQVTLNADENVDPANRGVALSLFRIAQEALRNAVIHGHAGRASVSLSRDQRTLALSVVDDGEGFDVAGAGNNGGLGLVSMEERARLVQGTVDIRSRQGSGTAIDVRVPLSTVDQVEDQPSDDDLRLRPRPERSRANPSAGQERRDRLAG